MKSKLPIVISGISGRYPESDNLQSLWANLLNGVEMCTLDVRNVAPVICKDSIRVGKIKDLYLFDNEFFEIPEERANQLSSFTKKTIEVIYEAIYDSGSLLSDWKKQKTSLSFAFWATDEERDHSLRDIYSGRILESLLSHVCSVYDINGGAILVDTACAASGTALELAIQSIASGNCDRALVVSFNSLNYYDCARFFSELNMINKTGLSKCLDASANGFCMSESIVAIVVQRKCDAKRVYATILDIQTNSDGYKPEGITFPKFETQSKLFQSTLKDLSLDPLKIDYIEAHITGTQAGDPIECASIQKAYRSDSIKPLYLGCLKSNIGHGMGTAFLNNVSKVVKIFQTGLIPANNNYNKPNPRIEGLINGILVPVLENEPFDGDIIPVHALGFGGVNVVAMLEANSEKLKEDDYILSSLGLPRLVQFCNRNLKGLETILEFIKENASFLTKYTLALLNDLSKADPYSGLNHRGYLLLDDDKSIIVQKLKKVDENLKPWFIFSPMFEFSFQKYKQLMLIKNIEQRLQSLTLKTMKSVGINIIEIIKEEKNDFTSRLIASIAMQISLYDLLSKDLKIVPDALVGHSLGSIAAAYADNCLSDDHALAIAYHIGTVCSAEFNEKPGAMVKINLKSEEVEHLKYAAVDIASYESDNCTILSGPKDTLESFLNKIDADIKQKKLCTDNIPFHSSFFETTNNSLKSSLSALNLKSVYSSGKLLLTSDGQNKVQRKCINVDFFLDLLKSPCDMQFVHQNSHSNTLKIGIGDIDVSALDFISLLEADSEKNEVNTLLECIGELYLLGLNPAIENLYEVVNYPVPRETQSLSHLCKWNHDKKWYIPNYSEFTTLKRFKLSELINLNESDYSFISGHKIDGRILFPATGHLYLAWKLICAKHSLSDPKQYAIELYNVRITNAIYFGASNMKTTIVMKVNQDTRSFIICNEVESNICVSGKYQLVNKPSISNEFESGLDSIPSDLETGQVLDSNDVYKELRIRGYDYSGSFRGINQASSTGNWALIKDTGHWITFADSCLQLSIFTAKNRKLFVPANIEYAYIDPNATCKAFSQSKNSESDVATKLAMRFDRFNGIGYTQGLIIKGLTLTKLKRSSYVIGTKNEYRLFDPFEAVIRMNERCESRRNEYISHCLTCIKKMKRKSIYADETIDNFISNSSESHLLLQLLHKSAKEPHDNRIQSIKLILEANSSKLLNDMLFLEPLKALIERSIGVVSEYFYKDEINAIAFNFLQMPSEVSLSNEKLFNSLNVKVKYAMTYSSMSIDSNILSDQKFTSIREFELIFVRDASTYLPIIVPDSLPVFDMEETMITVFNSLKEGGICIIITRTNLTHCENELYQLFGAHYDVHFDKANLKCICEKIGFIWIGFKHLEIDGYCSILVRRPFSIEQVRELSIIRVTLHNFDWIEKIKAASKPKSHKIWLTGGGHDNGIIGLTRSLNRDPHGYNVRCYYDPSKSDFDEITIPDDILAKDCPINVVDENGSVGTYIYLSIQDIDENEVDTEHCYVDTKIKGDLASLRLFQAPHSVWKDFPKSKLKKDSEIVTIHYGALNFRDIMISTRRIAPHVRPGNETTLLKSSIGFEFSGIDSEGNRIMGFCDAGGFSSSLLIDESCLKVLVPNEWTLEEAATVPIVYLTAYYGLICRGNLQSRETVLIHAGSGGVGQAAINICLARQCQVFTTVGSQAKRDFIKKQFPCIDDQHIGDSRSTSFEELILKMTDGRGVDLVLNSLSGDKLTASLRCLADFGRFIEIGKYDIAQNTLIDNILMDTNKSFHVCCILHLFDEVTVLKNQVRASLLNQLLELLKTGIESREVKPLQTTIFEVDQLEKAFRYMATGKHIGKILIRFRDEHEHGLKIYKTIGQTFFDLNKVYIITGGLGGLGLELVYWMRERGATNFILTSRTGIRNSHQQYMINKITENNYTHIKISISKEDCHTYDSAERLMRMASGMGVIGGIFHLAMVLKDNLFENQTIETFSTAVNPKAFAAQNLDRLTRLLPYKLDYFVCFSSVSVVVGLLGQSNYAFGNSSIEQICLKRVSDGFHALAIQLGVVGDTGAVSDIDLSSKYYFMKFHSMRLPQFFKTLDKLLLTSYVICLSAITTERHEATKPTNEKRLEQTVLSILTIEADTKVDPNLTLQELGIDSLMSIEIQQCLETKYNCLLTAEKIRKLHIYELSVIEQKKLKTLKI